MPSSHHNLQTFVQFTSDKNLNIKKVEKVLNAVSKDEGTAFKIVKLEKDILILLIRYTPRIALSGLVALLQTKMRHPWHHEYKVTSGSVSDVAMEFFTQPEDQ